MLAGDPVLLLVRHQQLAPQLQRQLQRQQHLLPQPLVLRGLQLLLQLLPRPPLQLLLLWLRMVVLRQQQLQLLATLRLQHPPRQLLSLQRMMVNLLRAWLQRLHLPQLLLIVSHQPRPPLQLRLQQPQLKGPQPLQQPQQVVQQLPLEQQVVDKVLTRLQSLQRHQLQVHLHRQLPQRRVLQ